MSTRPKSERMSPPPPPSSPLPNQRDAAIQELRRVTQLAAKLRQQLDFIPELDRYEAAAANVSEISEAMKSSLSILQSVSEHSSSQARAVAVASPAARSSDGGAVARYGAVSRARKVRHRRGRLGEELPIREILTEAPENDRFHWRKYGEKKILNAEYPRLYYKCGYSDDHRCPAKKYVQQHNNGDPPLFMVTLIYEHTCETLFRDEPSSSSGSSQVLDFTKASICPPLMAVTLGLKKEEETSTSTSMHSYKYELSPSMSLNGDQADFFPGTR
ncbi:EcWRKY-49, partial [Eragrostis curvula]